MTSQFSPKVSKVLAFSREEAARLASRSVGPEHLLLGLLRMEESPVVDVFRRLNLNLQSVKTELEAKVREDELDLLEINEAFAAMPLVSTKLISDGDDEVCDYLRSICNVNGGAVAIGHPMGATGLRLIMTLMYELRRRGGGKGIACLCGGLAQGDGVLIEVK